MSADILIVDDEADIRELIAGIMEDEGFETREASNSDEALSAVANRRQHSSFWISGFGVASWMELKFYRPSRKPTRTCR